MLREFRELSSPEFPDHIPRGDTSYRNRGEKEKKWGLGEVWAMVRTRGALHGENPVKSLRHKGILSLWRTAVGEGNGMAKYGWEESCPDKA